MIAVGEIARTYFDCCIKFMVVCSFFDYEAETSETIGPATLAVPRS